MTRVDTTHKIRVLVAVNPKRIATRRGKLWQLYQDGMTIAAFIEAIENAGYKRSLALSSIRWDLKRNFIGLS
jgi:hypothetical protein